MEDENKPYVSPYRVTPAIADPAQMVQQDNPVEELAGRGSRLLAYILDGVIIAGPFLVTMFLVDGMAWLEDDAVPSTPALIVGGGMLLIAVIANLIFLSTRGQSMGKMAMKIKIIDYNTGETAGFFRAVFMRGFVGGLPRLIPIVGGLYDLADPLFIFGEERRCLHDMIGGTSVVRVE